jgi:hypothetical protein
MSAMSLRRIALLRLAALRLAVPHGGDIASLITYMGAVQAQDYAMAKWAVGIRLAGAADMDADRAVGDLTIVRTHVLRPTWHFIPAADAVWMIALSADRIKAQMGTRDRELGLDAKIFAKANGLLAGALTDNRSLGRADIALVLNRAGIKTDENRLSHILMHAEQDMVICSSAYAGSRPAYRLFPEVAAGVPMLSGDEARTVLARRYITARGPATRDDFAWWSGLPLGEAGRALAALEQETDTFVFEGKSYVMMKGREPADDDGSVLMLPAFDELLIGYRDRSAHIMPAHNPRAISSNGVFRPIVVARGQVAGIWSRTTKSNEVKTEVTLFDEPGAGLKTRIEEAVGRYGAFLGKKVSVSFVPRQ